MATRYGFMSLDNESSVYRQVAAQLTHAAARGQDWRLLPKDSSRFNLMLGCRNKLPYSRLGTANGNKQLVNYYRGSSAICRKAALVRTLRIATSRRDSGSPRPQYYWPEWFPVTFIIYPTLPQDTSCPEGNKGAPCRTGITRHRPDERQEFIEMSSQMVADGKGSVWIAKSTAGSKGTDIFISSKPEDLLLHCENKSQAYVIQKYIENPLLLPGNRKFDIRVWVLLDSRYDIHVFNEGVIRTSSDCYDPDDLSKVTSHLTNHCLQKALSENYSKFEEGNEMFFEEFDRLLQDNYHRSLQESVLPQIHSIVKYCLLAIKEQVNTAALSYASFQLFGFDFMLDTTLKVWLIEVNGAPACASKLKRQLADSVITTAIDPLFPPSYHLPNSFTSGFYKIT